LPFIVSSARPAAARRSTPTTRASPSVKRHPRWLGGIGSFTLVLHTWTQDLRRHVHVHALMACGALQRGIDGQCSWVQPKRSSFLFPVHALSRVLRGKFLQALQQAGAAERLPRDPADSAPARAQRLQALRGHDWVVYAKTPLAGAAAVLDYLSQYTHRTAIGTERLVAIAGDKLLMRVRADDTGGKRTIAMPGEQFIARLLQHVLPAGFKRIRHYVGSPRRPRPSAWRWRGGCWPCRNSKPRRSRMHRPSCAAWRPSRSSAALIAGPAIGAWWNIETPIVR
jgi:hypothetical protein